MDQSQRAPEEMSRAPSLATDQTTNSQGADEHGPGADRPDSARHEADRNQKVAIMVAYYLAGRGGC